MYRAVQLNYASCSWRGCDGVTYVLVMVPACQVPLPHSYRICMFPSSLQPVNASGHNNATCIEALDALIASARCAPLARRQQPHPFPPPLGAPFLGALVHPAPLHRNTLHGSRWQPYTLAHLSNFQLR